jgi:predicted metal-dependent enzyme (double-stranded beta helix superfamily)
MIKLLYKPVALLVSVLGGILAGAIFKQIWKLAAREDDAPKATDARRGWREVLSAAALQGAVYAVVKAVVDRGAAEGTHKLTGVWPGDNAEQKQAGVTMVQQGSGTA